jgi:hypothetical protein
MNRREAQRKAMETPEPGEGRSMSRRQALEDAVRTLAPRIPAHEFEAVVDHALVSPGLRKAMPERAAWLSLTAYMRATIPKAPASSSSTISTARWRNGARGGASPARTPRVELGRPPANA